MKFGVVGAYGTVHEVLEMAVAAEEAGWDGFFTWDGISVGPVDTYDPWTLLAAVAVRTSRITLGAMIFPLARRRPWKVAREALTVDHLSGGRLVLPVGLGAVDDGGFSRVSGEALDRRERAQRLDECLDILDLAFRGEPFDYSGAHYQVRDMVFQPRPVQRPRVPIWVVGSYPSGPSLRRAARWDGILPTMRGAAPGAALTPADIEQVTGWLSAHRPTGSAPFEVVCEGVSDDDRAVAAEHLGALAEAGATWWIESRWEGESATPEGLLRLIRQGPPQR